MLQLTWAAEAVSVASMRAAASGLGVDAVGGQRLLVHHPAGITRRVEIGDVVRHHVERGGVGLERADGGAGDAVQAHELQTPKTIFRQSCRKPRAMIGGRFFGLSRGFSHCSEPCVSTAEFAASAAPARLFV